MLWLHESTLTLESQPLNGGQWGMASSHSRPELPLTLQEVQPFIRFTAHAGQQERHSEPLRLHSLPRRGCTLREDIPENSFTKDFKLLSDVRVIQRHPINTCISHQDWVHLFGVNIPLLYLVPHVPGSRSILHFQWVKHCWISVNRMLLKPLLIALADGFNNRRAPTCESYRSNLL